MREHIAYGALAFAILLLTFYVAPTLILGEAIP